MSEEQYSAPGLFGLWQDILFVITILKFSGFNVRMCFRIIITVGSNIIEQPNNFRNVHMPVIHSPFIGIMCRQVVISCQLWYISFMFVIEDVTLTEMRLVDVLCNFQRHFSYIVVVRFIDGGNRKEQLTCQELLTNYHTELQQVHFAMSRQQINFVNGNHVIISPLSVFTYITFLFVTMDIWTLVCFMYYV